jgi:aminoglycoside phosphotransferase (APT) family kinase protein
VDVQPLARGLVNQSYRVARAGRLYSLRVTGARGDLESTLGRDLGLELDRDWECRVLECAAAAGLAPQVECCLPEQGILVLEWLTGRAWTPAEIRRPRRIDAMAALLRRVHSLPLPRPARTGSPAAWIAGYAAALTRREAGRALPSATGPAAPRGAALSRAAQACLERLAAIGAAPAVLCHGDLHRLNVAAGPRLKLLDWEYAHVTDPFWDLAGWIANNDWDEGCAVRLLRSYLQRPAAPEEAARLELLVWLYDYVCLLWSELHLQGRSGAPRAETAARALQLAARLGGAGGGRAARLAAH